MELGVQDFYKAKTNREFLGLMSKQMFDYAQHNSYSTKEEPAQIFKRLYTEMGEDVGANNMRRLKGILKDEADAGKGSPIDKAFSAFIGAAADSFNSRGTAHERAVALYDGDLSDMKRERENLKVAMGRAKKDKDTARQVKLQKKLNFTNSYLNTTDLMSYVPGGLYATDPSLSKLKGNMATAGSPNYWNFRLSGGTREASAIRKEHEKGGTLGSRLFPNFSQSAEKERGATWANLKEEATQGLALGTDVLNTVGNTAYGGIQASRAAMGAEEFNGMTPLNVFHGSMQLKDEDRSGLARATQEIGTLVNPANWLLQKGVGQVLDKGVDAVKFGARYFGKSNTAAKAVTQGVLSPLEKLRKTESRLTNIAAARERGDLGLLKATGMRAKEKLKWAPQSIKKGAKDVLTENLGEDALRTGFAFTKDDPRYGSGVEEGVARTLANMAESGIRGWKLLLPVKKSKVFKTFDGYDNVPVEVQTQIRSIWGEGGGISVTGGAEAEIGDLMDGIAAIKKLSGTEMDALAKVSGNISLDEMFRALDVRVAKTLKDASGTEAVHVAKKLRNEVAFLKSNLAKKANAFAEERAAKAGITTADLPEADRVVKEARDEAIAKKKMQAEGTAVEPGEFKPDAPLEQMTGSTELPVSQLRETRKEYRTAADANVNKMAVGSESHIKEAQSAIAQELKKIEDSIIGSRNQTESYAKLKGLYTQVSNFEKKVMGKSAVKWNKADRDEVERFKRYLVGEGQKYLSPKPLDVISNPGKEVADLLNGALEASGKQKASLTGALLRDVDGSVKPSWAFNAKDGSYTLGLETRAGTQLNPSDLGMVHRKVRDNLESELRGIMGSAKVPRKEQLNILRGFRKNFKTQAASLTEPRIIMTAKDMAQLNTAIAEAYAKRGGQTREAFAKTLAIIIKGEIDQKGRDVEQAAMAGLWGVFIRTARHINDVKVGAAAGAVLRGAPRNTRSYLDSDQAEGEKVTPLSDLKGE